ncbi:MAG: hypothetical protein JXA30_22810 [Deltaproteobacteria bacterium]|nr:hypothetical protein [Deltaproteobacteria bacterium]
MSVTVTLKIYSGRPNPSWQLTRQQIDELVRRYANLGQTSSNLPPGITGKLGYSGFSIAVESEGGLPEELYVHENVIADVTNNANVLDQGRSLEQWLFSTNTVIPAGPTQQYMLAQLEMGPQMATVAAYAKTLVVPKFEPNVWNSSASIRKRNNCYNYANNKITNTFAQPGRGSGSMFGSLVCDDVRAAAERDGLQWYSATDNPAMTPIEGHFVALVIWPEEDYHWYRLDDNTYWSHKMGDDPARDTDESGNRIQDPQTAARGPYTIFCCYMQTFPDTITIR